MLIVVGKLCFLPISASGANTMLLHYAADNRQLQAGDIVYIDYGADYDYYTKKIHLRLEDTILITPTVAENLTASVPAEVEEIYALTRRAALGSGLK